MLHVIALELARRKKLVEYYMLPLRLKQKLGHTPIAQQVL